MSQALAVGSPAAPRPLSLSVYAGLFLITLSGLMFEIGLTRIFSATIWYHFAFVAISVALLGWGLGGFAVHLARGRHRPSLDLAGALSLVYAASIPLALWFVVRAPFQPERLSSYFLASLLPFFLAGTAISVLFDLGRERSGSLYFADLLGASLGAATVTLFLSWLGGEAAVLAVAAAPALAAALLSRRLRWPSAAVLALLAAALGLHGRSDLFRIKGAPTKGMYQHLAAQPGAEVALTGWNSYSRIDAVTGFPPPFLARLYIDSDAWTNVLRWDGRVESMAHARDWYRALPFRLTPGGETLVIGPGGGSDVIVALASGSRKVTAVEMNPLMLRFVRHFGEEAGGLYDHPLVDTVLSEGRSYVARTDRRFDVIFLGFVDSWAAVASGGLSLSENYLYTTEAFRDYYDHLTPDGALVIMRWDVDVPRLVTNTVALLGPQAAAERVVALLERRGTETDPPQMIFLLRRRPFTPPEVAEIAGWPQARPLLLPGRAAETRYEDLLAGRQSLSAFAAASPDRVDPVFDDRPFFFARQKPWGLPGSMRGALLRILLPTLALCAALLVLGRPRGAALRPYAGSLVYFASLGLGFISVELALLQHLTLLLGHPIFTLSVLLFTLLAACGLGAHLGGRVPLGPVCLAVAGTATVYALFLPGLVRALLPLPLPARVAVAVALVAPLGFAMGIPFPSALRRTGRGPFPAPPFYWGLNGVMSVLGSVGTVLLAVTLGFRVAMVAGAACYLAAALAARAFPRAGDPGW